VTRDELLNLPPGAPVQVLLHTRTYNGPIIDPRHGWVPATVNAVGETLNGEINLWVDITYPDGLTGHDGSTSHRSHFTAQIGYNVRPA
jgi:hypothetical protein